MFYESLSVDPKKFMSLPVSMPELTPTVTPVTTAPQEGSGRPPKRGKQIKIYGPQPPTNHVKQLLIRLCVKVYRVFVIIFETWRPKAFE